MLEAAKKDIEHDTEILNLDWDTQVVIAIFNYLRSIKYYYSYGVAADELTSFVSEHVLSKYKIRPETVGRILNKKSLLMGKPTRHWDKDKDGNCHQKTYYVIDPDAISKFMKPYEQYIECIPEDSEDRARVMSDISRDFDPYLV